jgi:hypothetical protein
VLRKVFLGGGVRRLLGAEIHLQSMKSSLAQAATPNDCWIAIGTPAAASGFHQIQTPSVGGNL